MAISKKGGMTPSDDPEMRQAILGQGPTPILAVDRDYNIIFMNLTGCRWLGREQEDIVGKKCFDLLQTSHCQTPTCPIRQAMEADAVFAVEGEIPRDGEPVPIEYSAAPLKDSSGKIVGGIEHIIDATEHKQMEDALRKQTRQLDERVKELDCLYGISGLVESPDLSLEGILQGVVGFLPPAWQYPEIACARITLDDREFKTENFEKTAWKQASDVVVRGQRSGALEVRYLEERPESDEGPFLSEERMLLDAIAERLGRITERKQAEEALEKAHDKLETRVEERTAELTKANETLRQQSQAILELSTPVIKLWDEIVILPLVGVIDTRRAQQMMERLLQSIVETESRVAIMDVTGVPVIDTSVAQHLLKTVRAAGMLGADVVITGFSPDAAQTLTKLGIDLSAIRTRGTLQAGIAEALALVGRQVTSR